jgi:hypothetical protein
MRAGFSASAERPWSVMRKRPRPVLSRRPALRRYEEDQRSRLEKVAWRPLGRSWARSSSVNPKGDEAWRVANYLSRRAAIAKGRK